MNKAVFTKDLENKQLHVERTFNAPRSKVWKAWTDASMLEKWWAPKPWKAVTKSFEFKEGGQWLYYMLGPEGEKHWGTMDYKTIDAENRFTAVDAFSDEHGNPTPDSPITKWEIIFEDQGDKTIMRETSTFDSLEGMEKLLNMGMEEGFSMGLDQLEELLAE